MRCHQVTEINLTLIWSANCIIFEADRTTTFTITDAKLYLPLVTSLR